MESSETPYSKPPTPYSNPSTPYAVCRTVNNTCGKKFIKNDNVAKVLS